MKIEFGFGHKSKQLEKLILSRPEVFDGFYDQVNFDEPNESRIYEVSMKMGYNFDYVHSMYGTISYILKHAKYIQKCNDHNCCSEECREKRKHYVN